MKTQKFQLTKYSSHIDGNILELQKNLWSQDKEVCGNYLSWKYKNNPYVDNPLIYVAIDNTQVVGMLGAYGSKWQVSLPTQTFIGLCFGDLVIDRAYRNQGIFSELMRFALDDISDIGAAYAFDFSARFDVAVAMKLQGWRGFSLEVAHWHNRSRLVTGHAPSRRSGGIANIRRRLRTIAHTFPLGRTIYKITQRARSKVALGTFNKSSQPFTALDRYAAEKREYANHPIVVAKTARISEMAKLLEQLGYDGRLQHVRDEQYFAWRFQNPLAEYRFLYWDQQGLQGYLILQAQIHTPANVVRREISIVDWEASNPDIQLTLLKAAMHWGNFSTLHTWSGTLSPEAKAALKVQGFNFSEINDRLTQNKANPCILLKPLGKKGIQPRGTVGGVDLSDRSNWDLRTIYSDNV